MSTEHVCPILVSTSSFTRIQMLISMDSNCDPTLKVGEGKVVRERESVCVYVSE